jgi:hypothetical protein
MARKTDSEDSTDAADAAPKTIFEQSQRRIWRARAGDHRAPTDYVALKLRIRAPLVKKIQKEADRKKQSANSEAVERLEQSFALDESSRRDSDILNMMLGFFAKNRNMMQLLTHLLSELRGLDEAGMIETTKRVIDLLESQHQSRSAEKQSLEASKAEQLPTTTRDDK